MKGIMQSLSILLVMIFTISTINAQNTSRNFSNQGRDWYVSKNTGSGQLGTKERPAKDLGNIIHHLKPNDRIHIAEGIYMSKGKKRRR